MFVPFSRNGLPLLLVGAAILVGGCHARQTEEQVREVVKTETQNAKNQLSGIKNIVSQVGTLTGGDSKGRPLWKIGANQMRVIEGDKFQPRRAILTTAWAKLYQSGKEESQFKAARMEFINTAKGLRLILTGDVRVVTSGALLQQKGPENGPVSLLTPRVDVNVKQHRLQASQGVVMKQAVRHITVRAQRLDASTAFTVAQLSGKVTAQSPQGNASADQAIWNWQARRMQATGNVMVKNQDTTITGTKLQANTATTSGVLTGAVKVRASGGEANAGTVHFNWNNRTVAASDSVILQKDGASLRAAHVDADADLNKATAEGSVVMQKQDVTLHADHVAGFDKMTRAVATGDVILTRADLVVTGSHAEATNIGSKDSLRVTARGGVTAKNKAGSVRASNVTWGGGEVVANGDVTFVKDGDTLSGERLQSDDKFEHATLTGDVHGRLAGAAITAGKLIKIGEKISAVNGVLARRDNLQMRAARLDATQTGNDAVLTGGVEVKSDDGITIRSPQARYDRRAGKIYANNGVFFQDNKRGIQQRGKTLIYDIVKRQGVMTEVTGKTTQNAMRGVKLF